MAGMYNPIKAAHDIYYMLLAAPQLQNVNIVLYRLLRLQHVTDFRTILTTARNGSAGRGIVVMEPVARCNQKNVLAFDWVYPIISMEVPDINDIQSSGPMSAYQLAQIACDVIHNWADDIYGTMNVDSEAIQDAPEFEFSDSSGMVNTIAKRTQVHILGKNNQTVRCGQLQGTVNGSSVAVACASNPTASIYYTIDGTFPANTVNSSARLYSGAVTVQAGSLFRAVGYVANLNNSACLSIQF